ncbi:hypothetical protein [Roseococcus sp.]|uniref:hypothetical protein n=1 Tax=Roseococcus sp. TaxID=2109646 RepID=UPI003BA85EAE
MPKFNVIVSRLAWEHTATTVEADTEEQAISQVQDMLTSNKFEACDPIHDWECGDQHGEMEFEAEALPDEEPAT